jgi:hypothetical protein
MHRSMHTAIYVRRVRQTLQPGCSTIITTLQLSPIPRMLLNLIRTTTIKATLKSKTMSLLNNLDSWRNVTGIGHGGAWAIFSSAVLSSGRESVPECPWSGKSSLSAETMTKRSDTTAGSKINAVAPSLDPGGLEHTGIA